MNRYLYTLSVLVDGQWEGKQYSTYPHKEMDKIQENGQIWKLAITKNPYYKEPTENTMKLINNDGRKAHIYYSGLYYVASDNGEETLIFPSNKEGTIAEYKEVGGAIGTSLLEVIGNFGSFLFKFKRT